MAKKIKTKLDSEIEALKKGNKELLRKMQTPQDEALRSLLEQRKGKREKARENRGVYKMGSDEAIKDAIENGTVEEKVALFTMQFDYKWLGDFSLTEQQKAEIIQSVRKDPIELELFKSYIALYSDLQSYQKHLNYIWTQAKSYITTLAIYLSKWSDYDRIAEYFTEELSRTPEREEELLKQWNSIFTDYGTTANKKVLFRVDGGKVIADITIEGGLYSTIQREAKDLTTALRNTKAYVEAIEDYLLENGYYLLMPLQMEMIIENIKDERFMRYHIEKKYLRSELNHKKVDKGEPVTKEEEFKAVAADYFEIKTDPKLLEYCKLNIIKIRYGRKDY